MQAIAFYFFSAITLFSGFRVVTSRNPVHCVLFLILAFFTTAGLFVLLGAEFLAMLLVVVYVGAVAVLFLFVVMMLDIQPLKWKDLFFPKIKNGGMALWDTTRYAVFFLGSFALFLWLSNFAFEQIQGKSFLYFDDLLDPALRSLTSESDLLSTGETICALLLIALGAVIGRAVARKGTNISFSNALGHLFHAIPMGFLVVGLLLSEIFIIASVWEDFPIAEEMITSPMPPETILPNTHALGQILYTDYIYVFQASGIVLLVAMIGAIVLTHRRRTGVKKQSISDQVNRKREDAIKVCKVEVGKGIEI